MVARHDRPSFMFMVHSREVTTIPTYIGTYLLLPAFTYLLRSHSITTPVFHLFDPVRDGGLYTNSYTSWKLARIWPVVVFVWPGMKTYHRQHPINVKQSNRKWSELIQCWSASQRKGSHASIVGTQTHYRGWRRILVLFVVILIFIYLDFDIERGTHKIIVPYFCFVMADKIGRTFVQSFDWGWNTV